jgi:hypothetical protein
VVTSSIGLASTLLSRSTCAATRSARAERHRHQLEDLDATALRSMTYSIVARSSGSAAGPTSGWPAAIRAATLAAFHSVAEPERA